METPNNIQAIVSAIKAVKIPSDSAGRSMMWKMVERGEMVNSSVVKRAFGRYDILESPYIIEDLYKQYGHLVCGPNGEEKITLLMAIMTLEEIADFFGY